MYTYSIFNLILSSEISLPELPEVIGETDVVLRLNKLNRSGRRLDSDLNFRGRISNLLSFSVYKGQEIDIEIEHHSDPDLVKSAIYGPILSILLRQKNFLVLHGSCVSSKKRNIAFIGRSKSGKSTLAEAFFKQGYSVITDDILAIDFNSSKPQLAPSIPRIKLWPDSAMAMGYDPKLLPVINHQSQKRFHLLQYNKHSNQILSSIYFLDKGPDINIKKLSFRDAFLKLLKCSKGTALNNPLYVKSHFNYCSSLLKAVPIYSLQRPIDFSVLNEVIDNIRTHENQVQKNFCQFEE